MVETKNIDNTARNDLKHVIVKDNTLYFDSVNHVSEVVDALLQMKDHDRRAWERENGFTSMYTIIQDVHRALLKCTNLEEHNRILVENKDIIRLEGDEVKQLIPLDYFTIIINREGMYYVGKTLIKITPTSKIFILSGNKSKVSNIGIKLKSLQLEEVGYPYKYTDEIVVVNYLPVSKLKASNTPFYADRVNSEGDRKVKFWMIPWLDYWLYHDCDQYWQWRVEVKIENQKYSMFSWKFYPTTCYWEQTDIQMYMPLEQAFKFKECKGGTVPYDPYLWASFVISNDSWSSGSLEVERYSKNFTVGSIIQNNPLPMPTIINARGRATNRGMGGQFAGICEGGFKATNRCLPLN